MVPPGEPLPDDPVLWVVVVPSALVAVPSALLAVPRLAVEVPVLVVASVFVELSALLVVSVLLPPGSAVVREADGPAVVAPVWPATDGKQARLATMKSEKRMDIWRLDLLELR